MRRLFRSPRLGAGGTSRTSIRGLPLALAAGLALTAGACMSPAAKKPSAAGTAGDRAAGEEPAKGETPWWRKIARPGKEPMRPGDMEPGKPGIFSGKAGEFVLLGKDEVGRPADPTKPEKVRR